MDDYFFRKRCLRILACCTLAIITACTTLPNDPKRDPYECFNRKVFAFNMAFDRGIFRPIARAYSRVVPPPIDTCIGNFFSNWEDVTSIANNILQFQLRDAVSDTWRVFFNTTFGVLGLFDVATKAGLPKHCQDFGLTLARWGVRESPYLMVPFFGPSTIRDTIAYPIDYYYLSIWGYIKPDSVRYGLYGVHVVQKRASLLPFDKLVDEAIDPYALVRDAYLQRREHQVRKLFCKECEDVPEEEEKNDTYVTDDNDQQHFTDTSDADDTFVE